MKGFVSVIFLATLLSWCGADSFAQLNDSIRSRRWYAPDFVPLQFAGNIGLLSAGLGYSTRLRNYHVSLLYGYVPRSLARTYIHTIALKNNFPITRYALKNEQILIPYVGLGASIEIGGNGFFRQPADFPEGYYDFPKNLHALVYGGAKIQHLFANPTRNLRGVEFFVEAGTIDLYIWYKAMSNEIRFNEIFTLALGANILLSR